MSGTIHPEVHTQERKSHSCSILVGIRESTSDPLEVRRRIKEHVEAYDDDPDAHEHCARQFNELADYFSENISENVDIRRRQLDCAVLLSREASRLSQINRCDDHSLLLSNHSAHLRRLFLETHSASDIEESISVARKALELVPSTAFVLRATILRNLAKALRSKYMELEHYNTHGVIEASVLDKEANALTGSAIYIHPAASDIIGDRNISSSPCAEVEAFTHKVSNLSGNDIAEWLVHHDALVKADARSHEACSRSIADAADLLDDLDDEVSADQDVLVLLRRSAYRLATDYKCDQARATYDLSYILYQHTYSDIKQPSELKESLQLAQVAYHKLSDNPERLQQCLRLLSNITRDLYDNGGPLHYRDCYEYFKNEAHLIKPTSTYDKVDFLTKDANGSPTTRYIDHICSMVRALAQATMHPSLSSDTLNTISAEVKAHSRITQKTNRGETILSFHA